MENIQYKNYKLGDLFNINSSKKKFNANSIKMNGGYPYVVRSKNNNGIKGYTYQDEKYLNKGNTISFGQDTATMFYQKKPYFTGDKIKVMEFKDGKLNERLAIYLITLMRKAFSDFGWGKSSFNEKVLKNIEISLPVDKNDSINYNYIDKYIKKLELEYTKEIELNNKLLEDNYLKIMNLNNIKLSKEDLKIKDNKVSVVFKKYKLLDLFESSNGDVDIQKKDMSKEGINVVSSGMNNNGIIGKTSINSRLFNKGTITVDMFGNVFYQDKEYKMVTHARVFSLNLKYKELTENEGIYFVTKLKYLKKIFSYDNMASWEKIKNVEIELPSKGDKIDYEFIDKFIICQKKILLINILDDRKIFLNKLLEI